MMPKRPQRKHIQRNGVKYIQEGCWIREADDNFAIKTGLGQIIPGFKTRKKAKAHAEKHGYTERMTHGYKIIESPWYLDVTCKR